MGCQLQTTFLQLSELSELVRILITSKPKRGFQVVWTVPRVERSHVMQQLLF